MSVRYIPPVAMTPRGPTLPAEPAPAVVLTVRQQRALRRYQRERAALLVAQREAREAKAARDGKAWRKARAAQRAAERELRAAQTERHLVEVALRAAAEATRPRTRRPYRVAI